MMTKYCKGCGVRLQDEDREAIGYTPNLEKDYCQRCFRIRHYDDVMISMQKVSTVVRLASRLWKRSNVSR